MEARIARLESDVAHLTQRSRRDQDSTSARCATAWTRGSTASSRSARCDGKFAWLLPLCFAAGVIGAMARGFGWM